VLAGASLLGALATVPAAATTGAPPVRLRVMNYNIHAGAGEDNVYDLARTAAAIAAEHPDVVALEEVDEHWGARSDFDDEPAELARRLGMRVFFGPIYDLPPLTAGAPDRRYGVAILSRYPVVSAVDHEITRLSTQETDPVPAPAPGFPEVVLEAQGARVHIFATHLDYRADPSVRRLQVADTVAIMRAAGGRQILMGDLNAEWDAPELAGLAAAGLTDAWDATGQSDGATYPAGTPTARIDHIAVTPGIAVLDAEVPVTAASDHRPVVADLAVARGAEGNTA
jgi:endonuclease/exonuclease/phosphatase family metal-dependent hydrolase